jgi:hypothetical protein
MEKASDLQNKHLRGEMRQHNIKLRGLADPERKQLYKIKYLYSKYLTNYTGEY